MPTIPRYDRQHSISGKSSSVYADRSAFDGGVSEGLGALADLADTIATEKTRIEKEEQHYSTLRLGNQVSETALTFENEWLNKKGTDAYNSMQAVDQWAKNTRDNIVTGLKDKKLSRDVEQHIAQKSIQLKSIPLQN